VINSTGHTGLNIIDSDYTTIKYCEFYNNGWNGMNVQSSSNSTIDYNIAHHNIEHFGIQLYQNKAETGKMWKNNNMRYNIMYDNNNGMYSVHQEDNEVSNNLIFNNYGAGIILATNDIGAYAGRTKFYNNTISNNDTYGISNLSATQLIIKNNIIAGNGSNGIRDYQNSSNHVIDNNLYYNNGSIGPEINPLTGNPLFNDASNNDFSLKSGSPAIDAGADLSSVITSDIEGTPRPLNGVFDIGAYEYGSETMTISAPQNLRIQ
jgi:parallel beta-helix repeat protein